VKTLARCPRLGSPGKKRQCVSAGCPYLPNTGSGSSGTFAGKFFWNSSRKPLEARPERLTIWHWSINSQSEWLQVPGTDQIQFGGRQGTCHAADLAGGPPMPHPRGGPLLAAEPDRPPDPAPPGGKRAEPVEVGKPYPGFRLVPRPSGVGHAGGHAWRS